MHGSRQRTQQRHSGGNPCFFGTRHAAPPGRLARRVVLAALLGTSPPAPAFFHSSSPQCSVQKTQHWSRTLHSPLSTLYSPLSLHAQNMATHDTNLLLQGLPPDVLATRIAALLPQADRCTPTAGGTCHF